MKKLMKAMLGAMLSLLMVSALVLPSYAGDASVDGGGGNTSNTHNKYGINLWDVGWLLYVVDSRTQGVTSDTVSIFYSEQVYNKFRGAEFDLSKKTRYGSTSSSSYTQSQWNVVAQTYGVVGNIPMPIDVNTENSNADLMRSYAIQNVKALISSNLLNVTADVDKDAEYLYLIFEPVWLFPLYSDMDGSGHEDRTYIGGSTYQYSNCIMNNLLGKDPRYPAGLTNQQGLSEYGFYFNGMYSNGYYGTIICTDRDLSAIGMPTAGNAWIGQNFSRNPIHFSKLQDKSIGLGIGVAWLNDTDDASFPTNVFFLCLFCSYFLYLLS